MPRLARRRPDYRRIAVLEATLLGIRHPRGSRAARHVTLFRVLDVARAVTIGRPYRQI